MSKYQNEFNSYLNRTVYYVPNTYIFSQDQKKCDLEYILFNRNNKNIYPMYIFVSKIVSQHLWEYTQASDEFKSYLYKIYYNRNIVKIKNIYDVLREFYEKLINKYNITTKLSTNRGNNRLKSIQRYINLNFPVSCYLDIGCLDGHITEKIGRNFNLNKWQIHGIDIKPHEEYKNITFTQYDGKILPYSDNSFDLITCLMVLHHIPRDNLDKLMQEINRVMKPNGVVIIREHNVKNDTESDLLDIMHKFYDYIWEPVESETWESNYMSNDMWTKLFIDNGFSIHTPPRIYENGDNNPFMVYMCSYIKSMSTKLSYKKPLYRILPDDMKREKYHRRTKEIKNVLHWGQRKLLLSEIEFLTIYLKEYNESKSVYVIYAGSAPGTHIIYLSKLFPDFHFELYDPREFNNKLKNNHKINTYVQYFTDETATLWKSVDHPDKVILFISDIRTVDTETMTSKEVENRVNIDNQWQMNWYNIMKPKMAMFKFRLPYGSNGKTEYLKGDIYIQAYSPATSTETRLIVRENAETKLYDDRKFEEQMFYFNKYERIDLFDNIIYDIPENMKNGLTNNYDSVSEIHILYEYLKCINFGQNYNNKIIDMVGEINKTLSYTRTLFSDQPIKGHKKNMLKELQKKGYLPKHIKLSQRTFDTYIIPKYDWFLEQGLITED